MIHQDRLQDLPVPRFFSRVFVRSSDSDLDDSRPLVPTPSHDHRPPAVGPERDFFEHEANFESQSHGGEMVQMLIPFLIFGRTFWFWGFLKPSIFFVFFSCMIGVGVTFCKTW